jgi:hypothetical protein
MSCSVCGESGSALILLVVGVIALPVDYAAAAECGGAGLSQAKECGGLIGVVVLLFGVDRAYVFVRSYCHWTRCV